jgi:hypothetical protein
VSAITVAKPRNLRGFVFVDNAPPPDRTARLIGCTCGEAGGGRGIEQMTLRLILGAFILLALGGCQNPGRFHAALADAAAMD